MRPPLIARRQSGFTLIEIAIVLVIIGLLLGGILKGQELITSARVRNMITQLEGVQAAVNGFQDRYRALPGDFREAVAQIPGATQNGDGDGVVEAGAEAIAVWDHLSHARFINGSYTYNAAEGPATTPNNPWGARLQLINDAVYADANPTPRTNLKTGPQIPVEILAEIDRKIDDGNALRGTVRFSAYAAGGVAPTAENCHDADGDWRATSGEANCGAAILF